MTAEYPEDLRQYEQLPEEPEEEDRREAESVLDDSSQDVSEEEDRVPPNRCIIPTDIATKPSRW